MVYTATEDGRAPDAEAADVSIAGYDSIRLADVGWVRIRQFRRDPEGAFYVSGSDADGKWVENIPLPHGAPFHVR